MEIVQSAAGNIDDDWESLSRAPWVLNPSGCLLRASLIDQMERAGFTPMVAAEIHYNIHLQLALIQSGYGVGLLPARFIARKNCRDTVEVLRPPSFDLRLSVAITRIGQLGALERAVELLEHGIRYLFEAADTTKPVTRSRRRVPAHRRGASPPRATSANTPRGPPSPISSGRSLARPPTCNRLAPQSGRSHHTSNA